MLAIYSFIIQYALLATQVELYRMNMFDQAAIQAVDPKTLSLPGIDLTTDFIPVANLTELDPTLNFQLQFIYNNQLIPLDDTNRFQLDSKLIGKRPKLSWKKNEDTQYTVMMVDIDAPFGKDNTETDKNHQFLHWLTYGLVDPVRPIENEIASYLSPSLTANSTSYHRFVILMCQEPANIILPLAAVPQLVTDDGEMTVNRSDFKALSFLEANNMKVKALEYFMLYP